MNNQVVSESLQNSDFKSLEGLVEKEAVSKLKDAVSKLSVSQRQQLAVNKDDIFYAFPYQVILIFMFNLFSLYKKKHHNTFRKIRNVYFAKFLKGKAVKIFNFL